MTSGLNNSKEICNLNVKVKQLC